MNNQIILGEQTPSIGFAEAAVRTMKVMRYNIIDKDGLIVKKFADGIIKRILKLKINNNLPFLTKDRQLHPGS